MLSATNSVPVGIVSATVAVPATSSVFVNVIVYVIMSPTSTFPFAFSFIVPSAFLIVADFRAVITGVTTGVVCSSSSSSFTYAVLDIEPVAPSFTVTVNVIVAVPAVSPSCAGTVSSTPLSNVA